MRKPHMSDTFLYCACGAGRGCNCISSFSHIGCMGNAYRTVEVAGVQFSREKVEEVMCCCFFSSSCWKIQWLSFEICEICFLVVWFFNIKSVCLVQSSNDCGVFFVRASYRLVFPGNCNQAATDCVNQQTKIRSRSYCISQVISVIVSHWGLVSGWYEPVAAWAKQVRQVRLKKVEMIKNNVLLCWLYPPTTISATDIMNASTV